MIQVGDMHIAFQLVEEEGARGRLACSAPDSNEQDAQAVHGGVLTKTRASQPALIVIEGSDKGKRLILAGKARFKVGKSVGADLKLTDDQVAADHCLIELTGDRQFIIDLQSAQGTVLNGERIEKSPLTEGDYIRLGHTMLKFDRV
jgi:pSer/pThr/pTyr-binding forkhead associated (FHA) protein